MSLAWDPPQYPWGSVPTIEELIDAHNDPNRPRRLQEDPAPDPHEIATPCPRCGAEPQELEWFWFESPADTWQALCGRAGWASWCPRDRQPVDFAAQIMS